MQAAAPGIAAVLPRAFINDLARAVFGALAVPHAVEPSAVVRQFPAGVKRGAHAGRAVVLPLADKQAAVARAETHAEAVALVLLPVPRIAELAGAVVIRAKAVALILQKAALIGRVAVFHLRAALALALPLQKRAEVVVAPRARLDALRGPQSRGRLHRGGVFVRLRARRQRARRRGGRLRHGRERLRRRYRGLFLRRFFWRFF